MDNDDKKQGEKMENVANLDDARIRRLQFKGNYFGILEEFEKLRLKFFYDKLDKEEAINFITYCKYVMENGHSETTRLSAYYLYKKYIEGKEV